LQFFKIILLFLLFHLNSYAEVITIDNIRSQISNTLHNHLRGKNQNIVRAMYAQIGNSPIWINNTDNTKSSRLINALKNPLFNYKNKGFNQREIAKLFYELDTAQIDTSRKAAIYARLDVILTNAFVRLIHFVVIGDVDWNLVQKKLKALKESDDIKSKWEMTTKRMPNTNSILNAAKNGNINIYLTSLLPMKYRYKKLIKMLLSYRRMSEFSRVPYIGKVLKIGKSGKSVEKLKRRLQISGDYPKNAPINTSFDKTNEDYAFSE